MNAQQDIVLDLKRLSERSCLSVRWLRNYIKPDAANMIPHFKVKGKTLFKWSEFLAWLEDFRVKGNFNEKINGLLIDLKNKDKHRQQSHK
jgi:hypothetical protein